MKIVTYNIRYGVGLDQKCNLERIADEVRAADVIGLQEVERYWRRTGMVDQPERLGELLDEFYWAFGPVFDVDASQKNDNGKVINRRRQFGPMILSRWPILSTRTIVFPQLATINLIGMSTGALEAVIDTPEGPIRVYSIHLSSISPKERLLQIDSLLKNHEWIESCGSVMMGVNNDNTHENKHEAEHILEMDWSNGDPALPKAESTFIMGDFNSTPDSKEYAQFAGEADPIYGYGMHQENFVDSWNVAEETIGSPLSWWPDPPDRLPGKPLRLDYCFLNSALANKVKKCWIDLNAAGSDHKPYWVELHNIKR